MHLNLLLNMKKLLLIPFLFLLKIQTFAQTSPGVFDLSSGAYTFNAWDSASAALTYPANMIFHTLGNQNPTENTPANGDWACAYNLQTGCFVKGMGLEGVSFRNIGNSLTPTCAANVTGTSIYVGEATVALNTSNCENITVSWIGRMHSNFTYSDSTPISRFYAIACQYRIDTAGAFINLPGNYLFNCNSDSITYKAFGTADTLVAVLPDTCNNKPIVEVRWIYHQTAQNSGGPRPVLGVDDINITRDIVTVAPKLTENKKALYVYPNPINSGKLNFNKATSFMVIDILGQTVSKTSFANEYNTDNLSKGIYFIKTIDGNIVKFIKQ